MARISSGTTKRPKICFDEWNIWDPVRAPGDKGAEERYTVSDMLAMDVWCNVFIRQSAHVGMANITQSVNVISPLMTTDTGLFKQTTWWVYLLFAKYMRGRTWGACVLRDLWQEDESHLVAECEECGVVRCECGGGGWVG
jgi:alpha-N-arabinofuranosidase